MEIENFESVKRWRNNLKGGKYERACLLHLKRFCEHYSLTPDELIRQRIEELRSSDMTVRCKGEDRVMEYYKKLAETATGQAINFYRKICSFYRYNFVRLQTRDPGYTVQREQDYLASREETRKMCELLDLEAKTFLLILSESCGRSGAVANIKWKDVQEEIYSDELPMKIWLVQKVKLSRKKYFTFI